MTESHEQLIEISPLPMPVDGVWKASLDDKALSVSGPSGSYLFGCWDRIFGAWVWCEAKHVWREELPTRPFLNLHGGVEPEQSLTLFGQSFQTISSPPDSAPISLYIAQIPPAYRRLAAIFGSRQWLVLEGIWMEASFARYLDDELSLLPPSRVIESWGAVSTPLSRADRHKVIKDIVT